MRIMGLDVGAMTVGVAISDELLCTAQGIEVIRRKHESKLRQTYARIEQLIAEYSVGLVVIGYPKNMNNTVGERAEKSESFAADIRRRTGLETVLWDERLTTVSAHRVLDLAEMNYRRKNEVVDKLAAVLILQNYLDWRSSRERTEDQGNAD
ncbi:MAG: Holliday junction resolvase RuvX [Lachnospiraceae bacterium]|nr:Holliday junction resolvase RuvX [Lachnospiraceae bacterium]